MRQVSRARCSGAVLSTLFAAFSVYACATGDELDATPSTGVGGAGAAASGGTSGSSMGGGGSGSSGTGNTGPGGTSGGGPGGTSGMGGVGASGPGGAAGTAGSGPGGAGGAGGSTGGMAGTAGAGNTGGNSGTGGMAGTGGGGTCELAVYDFSTCPGGFTSNGRANDWACGNPTWGPVGDHTGGGSAWGTDLTGNSNHCAESYLVSPVVDLSGQSGQVELRFWHWFHFSQCDPSGLGGGCGLICLAEPESQSGGAVEVKDSGGSWVKLNPSMSGYDRTVECHSMSEGGQTCSSCDLDGDQGWGTVSGGGTAGQWVEVVLDITPYLHAGFQFRYHFASYDTGFPQTCWFDTAGWYIDDVKIKRKGC